MSTNRLVATNYYCRARDGAGRREIDVWSFDSKSCVKCALPTYYHTVHVYFMATVCLLTKLMVGCVYTEEYFTVTDLGMKGQFEWHPHSSFYQPQTAFACLFFGLNGLKFDWVPDMSDRVDALMPVYGRHFQDHARITALHLLCR